MIIYEDIEIRFDNFVVVPELNLTIEEGEFFTLLGPSGCGKTTILRALAGLVAPSRGRILINGKDVTKFPSDKRNAGMVFQNYALFPSMNVWENIAFGLKVAKTNKDEIAERVTQIAHEVDLNKKHLFKSISELSGGQQQRVAIARAMVMRPKILLLDEPLSNLDAKLRHQMRLQLKEMQSHFGITSVYVTHDQDEALSMSDRIAVIKEGRIEQCGPPHEIYQDSSTEFVCNFIGDVNRFASNISEKIARGSAKIIPSLPSYLRIEKVKLAPLGTVVPADALHVTGKIIAKSYHGLHYSYEVELEDSTVRAVVPEDGRALHYEVGASVSVFMNASDILQYPEGFLQQSGESARRDNPSDGEGDLPGATLKVAE